MTRNKCHSKSNRFVTAEQVYLQPVLKHRQRRGRRNRPFHTFAAATGKARSPIVDRRQVGTSSCSAAISIRSGLLNPKSTH